MAMATVQTEPTPELSAAVLPVVDLELLEQPLALRELAVPVS